MCCELCILCCCNGHYVCLDIAVCIMCAVTLLQGSVCSDHIGEMKTSLVLYRDAT